MNSSNLRTPSSPCLQFLFHHLLFSCSYRIQVTRKGLLINRHPTSLSSISLSTHAPRLPLMRKVLYFAASNIVPNLIFDREAEIPIQDN
ncbi:hypothetical protein P153DRAFT_133400 [Dothidotthia symphoricarpi CBS 119687]|uniref:Uncharacterized protein n=1 Tax=Dothidotthia symphoricarpi CBS 119687 TaxID=1392245 RepID=A0A6A6A026_9PLEO|nr:uncharacterized protein P153DRAFT_133400 [Dothidotthia symphoricarpi CBS 119687]KAF2124514.1 hypothetical protein P153DRAFT_133400 [Dothidotthia symphoricarpi CBS 119687]